MAVELTPLGRAVVGTLKWVAIPLLVAWIGMAFVGPNIGKGEPKKEAKVQPVVKSKTPISDHEKKFLEVREKAETNSP